MVFRETVGHPAVSGNERPHAMTPFDPASLPHAAAFYAGLPGGFDAHPHCRVRTAVSREIVTEFPQILAHPGIESSTLALLRQSMEDGEWMRDARGMALRLLVRDIVFETDAAYFEWYFDISSRLFAKPFYRVLMYVVSPTLVLLGATRRWAAFREGSVMSATVNGNRGTAQLTFPEGLYPPITLGGFGETIRAALAAARARNPEVELVEASGTVGRWRLGWS